MSSLNECPICMETIDVSINCVTTECKHSFHANCLMKNIAENGFGCPYCRTIMAETKDEDDDEDDDSEYNDDDEISDDDSVDEDEEEEYVLRGFRLFTNNVNGLQNDETDMILEEMFMNDANHNTAPPVEFVAEKLRETGVTYEQLAMHVCYQNNLYGRFHRVYNEYNQEFEEFNENLYNKMKMIIKNYNEQRDIASERNHINNNSIIIDNKTEEMNAVQVNEIENNKTNEA